MANQEHLAILVQSVEAWNQWREKNSHIRTDLSGADLRRVDLSEAWLFLTDLRETNLEESILRTANFWMANLVGTKLTRADLTGADLKEVNLHAAQLDGAILINAQLDRAYLEGASLIEADLRRASLSETNLSWAWLEGADLRESWLKDTKFNNTLLKGTDFSQAIMWSTRFGDVDLSGVKGLDDVIHEGPSTIGIDTIFRSKGNIPEVFLRGAGVPDALITYTRSLVNQPIDYSTCFISYSSKDKAFIEQLYADLQSQGIRCWFAPQDLKIGARIRPSIDESIRRYDKLLLVLSAHSLTSPWVEQEVETALAKERDESRTVLFPIRLDHSVMDIEGGWPGLIRNTRHIGDFTRWKQRDDYQNAFERLLRDLKTESKKR